MIMFNCFSNVIHQLYFVFSKQYYAANTFKINCMRRLLNEYKICINIQASGTMVVTLGGTFQIFSVPDLQLFICYKVFWITKISENQLRGWRSVSWQCILTTWIDRDQSWGRRNCFILCICNDRDKRSISCITPPVWTCSARSTRKITAPVNKFYCPNKAGCSNICDLLKHVVFHAKAAFIDKLPVSYLS